MKNKIIVNNTTDLDMPAALEYVKKMTMATTTMDELDKMEIGEWHAVVFQSGIGVVYTKNKSSITFTLEDTNKNKE